MNYNLLSVFVFVLLSMGCRDRECGRLPLPLAYEMEGLKTDKNMVRLGEVFFGDTAADTIRVYNPTTKERECRFSYDLSYMQVVARPVWLNPGDTGLVIVRLLTGPLGHYGDVRGNIRWQQENGMPGAMMPVSAHVVENFQQLSDDERRDAPRVYVAERNHDFGQLKAGVQVSWKARIENHGKKDLIIRNITTPCGCTVAVSDKRVIGPGDEGFIEIKFNTAGREGLQQKTISVMCNDWKNAEIMLTVKAMVMKDE